MNSKFLLITNKLESSSTSGRKALCYVNYSCLKKIYSEKLFVFELTKKPINNLNSIISSFCGKIDGIDNASIIEVIQIIKSNKIQNVFIDGSNLGVLAKEIKKNIPLINIIIFFHNIETRFFFGLFKKDKSFHSLGVLIANYIAERQSVKFADDIICLSENDSIMLNKIFGKKADYIAPMIMEDKLPLNFKSLQNKGATKYILFVGGNFYANKYGISWFVKNVVPQIQIKTYIVGAGFESLKLDLEITNKVKVLGTVKSLDNLYINAHFIIAPIFDGSGMNTKVVEALMYGKKIIGTSKAFSGFEKIDSEVAVVCDSKNDFINTILNLENIEINKYNKNSRSIFENNYSSEIAFKRLKKILIKYV